MPYKLDVLIEKRVVLQTMRGYFSIEEGYESALKIAKFFDNCDDKMGIVLGNMTNMNKMEMNLPGVRDSSSLFITHPNHLLTIVYGSSDKIVVNFLANAVAGILRQPLKAVANEAEAIKFVIAKCPDLAERLPKALKEYHEWEG